MLSYGTLWCRPGDPAAEENTDLHTNLDYHIERNANGFLCAAGAIQGTSETTDYQYRLWPSRATIPTPRAWEAGYNVKSAAGTSIRILA